ASRDGIYFPTATTQTETDEYTRYELLAPGSSKFKITYDVTATTAGAKYYYNPIHKGSAATEESVLDAMTGKPLKFEIVSGADARKYALMAGADQRPGPPRDHQDLRGCKELLRRRQDDRVRSSARCPAQQGRAARGLRSCGPDGAVAAAHRERRSNRGQLHEQQRWSGAARAA